MSCTCTTPRTNIFGRIALRMSGWLRALATPPAEESNPHVSELNAHALRDIGLQHRHEPGRPGPGDPHEIAQALMNRHLY